MENENIENNEKKSKVTRRAMNTAWVLVGSAFLMLSYQNCSKSSVGSGQGGSTGVALQRGDCSTSQVLGVWRSESNPDDIVEFYSDCTGLIAFCDARFSVPEGSMDTAGGDFDMNVATSNQRDGCVTNGLVDCSYELDEDGILGGQPGGGGGGQPTDPGGGVPPGFDIPGGVPGFSKAGESSVLTLSCTDNGTSTSVYVYDGPAE